MTPEESALEAALAKIDFLEESLIRAADAFSQMEEDAYKLNLMAKANYDEVTRALKAARGKE